MKKTSKIFRTSQSFLRNEFECTGKWNIPIVKKQEIDFQDISLISVSDIKPHDIKNKDSGVHYFTDDYRFEKMYKNPDVHLQTLKQYKFVCTPDFSLYREMPKAIQLKNTFKNRWCGAYWQSKGLKVIPTISWSDHQSYEFCFEGVEKGSIVAVGMIGSKRNNKIGFMNGYNEMLERIEPAAVIVLGEPFPEMSGNIIRVNYLKTRRIK